MAPAKDDFKDNFEAYWETLRNGTTVGDFLEGFKCIIPHMQTAGLVGQYRRGRKESGIDLKKLRDEVSPVARFIKVYARPEDKISFLLDNGFPDCTVCHQDGLKRGIEVTLARGKARFLGMTELNQYGETGGLIELQDDALKEDIKAAKEQRKEKEQRREMYSTDDAINNVVSAVEISAERKERHEGHTLLIEVVPDMHALPKVRWLCLPKRLADNATVKALKFSEVYVTGICGESDLILKIK